MILRPSLWGGHAEMADSFERARAAAKNRLQSLGRSAFILPVLLA